MEEKCRNYEQRIRELEQEVAKKNKTIRTAMWVLMVVSIFSLLAGVQVSAWLIPEGPWQLAVTLGICVLFLIPCFYALKLEVSVGAYQCKHCGHRITPTFGQAARAMHRGTTRYLLCPKCNQRSWCKKVWN